MDDDGPVTCIELRCLKPKVGSGTILEETPPHLKPDDWIFQIQDVIAGPLPDVEYKGNCKFDIPSYDQLVDHFNSVSGLSRLQLHQDFLGF